MKRWNNEEQEKGIFCGNEKQTMIHVYFKNDWINITRNEILYSKTVVLFLIVRRVTTSFQTQYRNNARLQNVIYLHNKRKMS